jgi:hydrogenase maturation protease
VSDPRVLVVGYGSTLHGDDGVGQAVAERLTADPRMSRAIVIARHQLTPDLAVDLSVADVVVLIDAAHDLSPGCFDTIAIGPTAGPSASDTHRLVPEDLVGLSQALYGTAPDVWLVRVGTATMALGDPMTSAVRAAIPSVAETVVRLAEGATPPSPGRSVAGHA